MTNYLMAMGLILAGGLLAMITARWAKVCTIFGVGGVVAGGVLGVVSAIETMMNGQVAVLQHTWNVPYGSLHLEIDAVSAFFLIPVFGLGAVAAIYGSQYLMAYKKEKRLGGAWFFYNLLVAGMAMVVTARNGVLFLVAWEVMSLASYFLVTFEDELDSVREAGWTYLVATHLGTAFLTAFFILLGRQTGSMEFYRLGEVSPVMASVLFLLAVIGFGTKAGFMPLHVWLPEAHPAAPSHVSAIMSGVMIKMGIYGIIRTIMLLGVQERWWCWLIIGIGVSSGVLGVLFALAQHDLKRLLAYSSVENIGIITIGIGVGMWGIYSNIPAAAVLGFAGGLFHVLNHALFKGLLFMGAGSVLQATGTRDIDRLGGLLKKMPWTGVTFLIGAVAISGLPPLNGFMSEILIYLGVLKNDQAAGMSPIMPILCVVGGLALIGGLAAACFTKAFGIIFLGESRSEQASGAKEVGVLMRFAMLILAMGCFAAGLFAPTIIHVFGPLISDATGLSLIDCHGPITTAEGILWMIVGVGSFFVGLILMIVLVRRWLLAGREIRESGTWDCGYAKPTAKIQYTASSFAQPVTELFKIFLHTKKHLSSPKGLFPQEASIHTETPDVARKSLFHPIYRVLEIVCGKLHWLQQGRVQMYVLYIALTLWVLLMWKLR
jgi:formate hydrogenlyase subunit 3/multisubunit Na+/H+ antiporter MnhD subunit